MFNFNNFNNNTTINFSNVNDNNPLKEKELELKRLEEEIENIEEELNIKRQKMLNFSKEHNNNKLNNLIKFYSGIGTDNGNKILNYDDANKNNEIVLKKQEKEIEKNNLIIKQNEEEIERLRKELTKLKQPNDENEENNKQIKQTKKHKRKRK